MDAHPSSESGMPRASGQRLQKTLAQLGLASRRKAEEWIRAGRLTVNGEVATLGTRVREADQIRLDGRLVRLRAPPAQQVLLCHRSPGEALSHARRAALATERPDTASAPTAPLPADAERASLIERLPRVAGRRFVAVSPMPQIDGGLELVTSDGELAEQLQRAVRGLTVEFSVRVLGELDRPRLAQLMAGALDRGVALDVISCEPAGGEASNQWYRLVVRGASGKDVRQLFERQGLRVSRVLRTRLGPVALDRALLRGQFRQLTAEELRSLLEAARPAGHRSSHP